MSLIGTIALSGLKSFSMCALKASTRPERGSRLACRLRELYFLPIPVGDVRIKVGLAPGNMTVGADRHIGKAWEVESAGLEIRIPK